MGLKSTDKDVEGGGEDGNKKASFFIGDDKETVPIKIVGPDDEEINPESIIVPPDGGWGWAVCFASFISNVIVDGIIFSFGLMQTSIKASFEGQGIENLTTKIGLIGSLQSGFYLFGGPFVSALANKYGFRVVAILGAIVGAAGFLGSYAVCKTSPSLYGLYALYGVVGGIGFNLLFLPSVIAVGFYFEKYRALATGIAVCGSGVGTFLFAPLTDYLVQTFGWEITMMAQSAIILSCALCGLVYKPVKPTPLPTPKNEKSGSSDPEKKLISPFPSPEGTPLLQRINRARQMEKWDSQNSMENESTPAITEAELKEALDHRKASTHSLSNSSVPLYKQTKRMSVPTMSMASDSIRQAAVAAPVRNKTVVGELVEIHEEHEEEDNHDHDDPEHRKEPSKPDGVENIQPVSTGNARLYIQRRTSGSKRGAKMVGENGALLGTRGSISEIKIGTSTLRVDEMSGSRILRVSSKKSLAKPMYRDDTFYTGSMHRISEYAQTVGSGMMTSREWSAVITNKPEEEEEDQLDASNSKDVPKKKVTSYLKKLTFINKILDLSLLASPTFLLLACSSAITMMGFFVPFMYLKGLAEQNGVEEKQVPYLIATIGIANTVGRILCGWLADRPEVNAILINNIALTMCGIVTIVAPLLNSFYLFIGYSLLFGLCIACFASLRSILIVELLGLGKLTNAFGLLCLFQGIAAMCGAPLAGFLFDVSGNFDLTFYVTGGLVLFSGILCYPLPMVNRWELKNKSR